MDNLVNIDQWTYDARNGVVLDCHGAKICGEVRNPEDGARLAAASELLAACKAQHDALDRLLAMLCVKSPGFLPSNSAVWPAVIQGHVAIAKAEGRLPREPINVRPY